jgi:hypothetical protein
MTDAQAKSRLLILTIVKLLAAALICGGLILMMNPDRFFSNPDVGRILATLLMLTGLADLVLLPRLLKRGWERQDKK